MPEPMDFAQRVRVPQPGRSIPAGRRDAPAIGAPLGGNDPSAEAETANFVSGLYAPDVDRAILAGHSPTTPDRTTGQHPDTLGVAQPEQSTRPVLPPH